MFSSIKKEIYGGVNGYGTPYNVSVVDYPAIEENFKIAEAQLKSLNARLAKLERKYYEDIGE